MPGAPSRPGVRFGPCKHLPSRGAHLPGRGAALGYFLTRSRVRSPVTPLVSPSLPLLTLPPPAHVCLHGVTPLSSCWRRRSAPPHPSESRHLCSPAPRFPARRLLVHLHSRLGGRRGLPRFSGGPGDILAGGVRTHGRREAPTQTETQSEAGDASEALPGAGMEAPGEEGGPCHRGGPREAGDGPEPGQGSCAALVVASGSPSRWRECGPRGARSPGLRHRGHPHPREVRRTAPSPHWARSSPACLLGKMHQ